MKSSFELEGRIVSLIERRSVKSKATYLALTLQYKAETEAPRAPTIASEMTLVVPPSLYASAKSWLRAGVKLAVKGHVVSRQNAAGNLHVELLPVELTMLEASPGEETLKHLAQLDSLSDVDSVSLKQARNVLSRLGAGSKLND